jgi:Flp pilus assembly protein protease CpaA
MLLAGCAAAGVALQNMVYFLAALAGVALYFDATSARIPNWLNVAGAATALASQLAFGVWATGKPVHSWNYELFQAGGVIDQLLLSAIGFSVMLAISLPLSLFGGIGAGDAKLFCVFGIALGWKAALQFLVFSVLVSLPISIVILIARKDFGVFRRLKTILASLLIKLHMRTNLRLQWIVDDNKHVKFPFMYAVFPAVLAASCLGVPVLALP